MWSADALLVFSLFIQSNREDKWRIRNYIFNKTTFSQNLILKSISVIKLINETIAHQFLFKLRFQLQGCKYICVGHNNEILKTMIMIMKKWRNEKQFNCEQSINRFVCTMNFIKSAIVSRCVYHKKSSEGNYF